MFKLFSEWPRTGLICLEQDTISGGDIGQATEPSVDAGTPAVSEPMMDTSEPAGMTPEEESYFHQITIPGNDGKDEVLKFKDPKELSDRYLANRLRRDDYTRKTQELAKERKDWERKIAEYSEKEAMLTRTSNKYSTFEKMLADVTPEQMQKIVEEIKGISKPQDPRYKELETKLTAIEREREENKRKAEIEEKKRADRQKYDSAARYLKSHYSDFEQEEVMKAMESLNQVDPEMAHQAVLEMLYFANKGKGMLTKREDPEGQPRTRRTAVSSASPPTKPMSLNEAKQAALRGV